MIIGLSGYAQSGKDSVAKILVDNYNFERIGFADALKDIALSINPIMENGYSLSREIKEFGWDITKNARTEARRFLQELGTTLRDKVDKDIWVNIAMKKVAEYNDVVISDVRFQNEADAIRKAGGQIWRVERPNIHAVNSHVSESDMDEWDFDAYVHNDGNLDNLDFAVKLMYRKTHELLRG